MDKLPIRIPADNAYQVLATFRLHARREGWTPEEIDEVIVEAKSGNYDHLLKTIWSHCVSTPLCRSCGDELGFDIDDSGTLCGDCRDEDDED